MDGRKSGVIALFVVIVLGLLFFLVIIFTGRMDHFLESERRFALYAGCPGRCSDSPCNTEPTNSSEAERAITGRYAKPGQEGVDKKVLEYCNHCCVRVG